MGGVLEHPAYSAAWGKHGLAKPHPEGWQVTTCGGAVCHVEQGRYGHPAKKATWLYAFGVDLPSMEWGAVADTQSMALVSWCGNRVSAGMEGRPRVGKAVASATPIAFAELLVAMARTAKR
jgi:hypothetical protein